MKKYKKTDWEWRRQLTPEQYRICRQQGTEPAFSGQYADSHQHGVYCCTCCGETLFGSEHKFNSGSGWPSFYQPISDGAVASRQDHSHGMTRSEVHCAKCGSHLGHLFPDGPRPTGMRYCINSISLQFDSKPKNSP